MNMKKLYQIWCVQRDVKPAKLLYPSPFQYVNGNLEYPLIEVISILSSRWSRCDFISMDRDKLEETRKYLDEIADSDQHYEIREVMREEF